MFCFTAFIKATNYNDCFQKYTLIFYIKKKTFRNIPKLCLQHSNEKTMKDRKNRKKYITLRGFSRFKAFVPRMFCLAWYQRKITCCQNISKIFNKKVYSILYSVLKLGYCNVYINILKMVEYSLCTCLQNMGNVVKHVTLIKIIY